MPQTTHELPSPSAGRRWLDARMHEDTAAHFGRLRRQWEAQTQEVSSLTSMVMHPTYQEIIGLGPQVVPILIDDLRTEPEHWFWALRAIVGDDKASGATTVAQAAAMWVAWFEAAD